MVHMAQCSQADPQCSLFTVRVHKCRVRVLECWRRGHVGGRLNTIIPAAHIASSKVADHESVDSCHRSCISYVWLYRRFCHDNPALLWKSRMSPLVLPWKHDAVLALMEPHDHSSQQRRSHFSRQHIFDRCRVPSVHRTAPANPRAGDLPARMCRILRGVGHTSATSQRHENAYVVLFHPMRARWTGGYPLITSL